MLFNIDMVSLVFVVKEQNVHDINSCNLCGHHTDEDKSDILWF